jgi:hypothetical protein
MMAVCTYPAQAAALHGSRELIHNHGKIFVKRGEWVHEKSRDAEKIEAVFASLATANEFVQTAVVPEKNCEPLAR